MWVRFHQICAFTPQITPRKWVRFSETNPFANATANDISSCKIGSCVEKYAKMKWVRFAETYREGSAYSHLASPAGIVGRDACRVGIAPFLFAPKHSSPPSYHYRNPMSTANRLRPGKPRLPHHSFVISSQSNWFHGLLVAQ